MTRQVQLPTVTTSTDECHLVIWDTGDRLLDVEIYPTNEVYWFYKDRTTGTCEGSEEPTRGIPLRVLELLAEMATEIP